MSVTVRFSRVYDWAILPAKRRVDRAGDRDRGEVYERHFRYNRRVRPATSCPPWVLGQEIGWVVSSPIDVRLTPVDDIQLAVDDESELATVGKFVDRPDLWNRGSGWLATARTDWLRFTQFRGRHGEWEAMFLPNGEGSVEWRLGWAAQIPDDMYLMFTGLDMMADVEIPTGILTTKQVNRSADNGGISLAVRPRRVTSVARGSALARIVLLHRSSLQAASELAG